MVVALVGVFTASSAQAQFGYFPGLERGVSMEGLPSVREARRKSREAAHKAEMAVLQEALRLAQEQTRVQEHAKAALALLKTTKPSDLGGLQKTTSKVRADYPDAFKSTAFQECYLEILQLVAPEQVPPLTAKFEAINVEVRASEDKLNRIETAILAEKSEAELREMRQRIAASEQRSQDLEDRLRYDQFERDRQNRILNSRINSANERLRDAEWEIGEKSGRPYVIQP